MVACTIQTPIPRGKVPWSVSRLQGLRCSLLPRQTASYTNHQHCRCHTRDYVIQSRWAPPVLHNQWNTCVKSLFAKPGWEFSVFNRPQNFSSLPWGEALWFSSCSWGLHLNHLRSGVGISYKQPPFFQHCSLGMPAFFFFLTSKWRISSWGGEESFGNALTLWVHGCTSWCLQLASSRLLITPWQVLF